MLKSEEKAEIRERLENCVREAAHRLEPRDQAMETEISSLVEFIDQADQCDNVQDIWKLKVGRVRLWQCFYVLLPWHFGLHRFQGLEDVAPAEGGWIFTRKWPQLEI
jgi:hypothetical protein